MSVKKVSIFAPAKLNLHLAVKDKREDGFHNLESVFLALDFGDTLYFEPIPGKNSAEIVMEGGNFGLPIEKNIVFRALSLFRSKTGCDQGFKITVEKRIPLGGGLGGGSSDAAAALLALNELAGGQLGRSALLEMAVSLGSDVPFFIYKTAAAWISGRGECIKPVKAPRCFFVLVNPGFPSDTAAAFRLLDEHRSQLKEFHIPAPCPLYSQRLPETEFGKIIRLLQNFSFARATTKKCSFVGRRPKNCKSLCKTNPNRRFAVLQEALITDAFFNDFLPVFKDPEKSVYLNIISQLRESGADFASLSGAGSTCFGVFKEKAQAEKAAAALRNAWGFVECCCPR